MSDAPMKVYLAGKMRGVKDHNFPLFRRVAADLRGAGFEVFDPSETGHPHGWTIRDFMFVDTAWICNHADAIALLPGWQNSLGATAEHALAKALGLKIMEVK